MRYVLGYESDEYVVQYIFDGSDEAKVDIEAATNKVDTTAQSS